MTCPRKKEETEKKQNRIPPMRKTIVQQTIASDQMVNLFSQLFIILIKNNKNKKF